MNLFVIDYSEDGTNATVWTHNKINQLKELEN